MDIDFIGQIFNLDVRLRDTPDTVGGGARKPGARVPKDDPTVEMAFHLGAGVTDIDDGPVTVCVDDVALKDLLYRKPSDAIPRPVPKIPVNQLGYVPGFRNVAVLRSESKTPVPWTLMLNDTVAPQGRRKVFGFDAASKQHVHLIAFSRVDDIAKGYVLRAGESASRPFEISLATKTTMLRMSSTDFQ